MAASNSESGEELGLDAGRGTCLRLFRFMASPEFKGEVNDRDREEDFKAGDREEDYVSS